MASFPFFFLTSPGKGYKNFDNQGEAGGYLREPDIACPASGIRRKGRPLKRDTGESPKRVSKEISKEGMS